MLEAIQDRLLVQQEGEEGYVLRCGLQYLVKRHYYGAGVIFCE